MITYEERISGDSPFKPELDSTIAQHPGRGSLKVQVSAANQSFPIKDVFVDIALLADGKRFSLYHDVTDSSGIVNKIVLPCCAGEENNSPETAGKNELTYLVSLFHPSFREVADFPVTVRDRYETILPVALEPLMKGSEA